MTKVDSRRLKINRLTTELAHMRQMRDEFSQSEIKAKREAAELKFKAEKLENELFNRKQENQRLKADYATLHAKATVLGQVVGGIHKFKFELFPLEVTGPKFQLEQILKPMADGFCLSPKS